MELAFCCALRLFHGHFTSQEANAAHPAHGDASNPRRAGCIIGMNARLTNNGTLTTHSHPDRNRWLIAIGVLKLLKAVLFVSMGFGVIRLLHKDIADVLLRAVTALRFDPENRIVNVLLEKSALLSPHRLKRSASRFFSTLRWTLLKARDWCWKRFGRNTSP